MKNEGVIGALQRAYTEGAVSAHQLITECVARIQADTHAGTGLNAIVATNGRALEQAQEQDEFLAAKGRLIGPLHGIPVIVKDNIHTVGMPTRAGAICLADTPDTVESSVTRQLKDAGAIILAKANMHELALAGTSISSAHGQTLNPYDRSRTPGGSSGGTGAALAAGYGVIGLGTDTVNSVRSPASANALVGLRPTRGLVSRAGVIPVAESQDALGPLALTVADVARVLDLIAGFDAADPVTAHAPSVQTSSYYSALNSYELQGRRIGILPSLFGRDDACAEVNSVVAALLDRMANAGAVLTEIEAPDIDATMLRETLDVQKWEFRSLFNDYLRERKDPLITDLSAFLDDGRYHQATLEQFLVAANAIDDRWSDQEYLKRRVQMVALRDRLLFLMAQHNVEALLYPLQQCLPVRLNELDQKRRNGIVAALTGLPAINVPAGFSTARPEAPLGLPVGIDLLGRPFDEARLLQLAFGCEHLSGGHRPPANRDVVATSGYLYYHM